MTPVRLALMSLAIASAAGAQSADSTGWTRHVVTSKKLGEDRPVLVSTPPGYNDKSRDGVLVLLDGNDDIQREAALANIRFLSNRGAIPPLIIVAVPNTKDRTHDLTPTPVGREARESPTAGGADNFAGFIIDELLPYIREHYHPRSTTVLAGHSYGGLFALHVAATRPQAFVGIVAMSPALQFNDSALVVTYADAIARSGAGTRLFATSGGLEEPIDVTTKRFAARLDSLRKDGSFAYRFYPDDDHGLTPIPSLVDGLRHVFAPLTYATRFPYAMFRDRADSATMVAALRSQEARYAAAARALGYEETFPEAALNFFGYDALNAKRPDVAVIAFRKNVERYPNSANVYDSLGDGLLAVGDTVEAKKQFARAIEVGTRTGDPVVQFTRDKLAALSKPAVQAGKP